MVAKVSPPKVTGGGGFVFEDDVCAWLLASMLVGEPVFGADLGATLRLDFQTRPDGWYLDDVLVTTANGGSKHCIALSIKSNVQFTARSAPSDFVTAAWEQWLQIGSKVFDENRDFIGLVTNTLPEATKKSVFGLCDKSRSIDPQLLPSRIKVPGWASKNERLLFSSFSCPQSLGRSTTLEDTARLLKRLRFLQHDFGSVNSKSQNDSLELCQRAVRSHAFADARALWSVLKELAAEMRSNSGFLTLSGLISRLHARVRLAEYPDHSMDWSMLASVSAREVGLVRDSIANCIHLSRDEQVAEVIDALDKNNHVALIGNSGVGKSALAKAAFMRRRNNAERTLWFNVAAFDTVSDFATFESTLRLQHPLAELLALETSQDPLVVIDGLDRLYSEHAFRNVVTLLQMLDGEQAAVSWRVLVVCQYYEWCRVKEELERAGASNMKWFVHEAKALQVEDLRPVRDALPALGRLLLFPRVGELLTNLKLLDLVARRVQDGAYIDASTWVGESSVAEWFWNAEIDRGKDRLARSKCARYLAQVQADRLITSVSVDSIEDSLLGAAQSLIGDQLVVNESGDRLTFAHDLYGDWARLRILLNHRADLSAFLQARHESPLWHRAIRLLGIHLLENSNGVDEWKTLMSSFDNSHLAVVHDHLLDAPVFAMNAGTLLESIFPDLVVGERPLLRRLMTRFLAFATVPNEPMLEIALSIGIELNTARASYRRPHWPYWIDVLMVLHNHSDDSVRTAPIEIAKVVEMWLEFAPPGSIRRVEAAELGLKLGQLALENREIRNWYDVPKDRERFYKCALLAAPERPDEVVEFARVAAERVPRLVKENLEAASRSRTSSMFGSGVIRAPWLDGPLERVDDCFANVVLDSGCIRGLLQVRPSIAREVILATLIAAPREEDWGGSWMEESELEIPNRTNWHPPMYSQGPFLLCLHENFEEGLELIMRLVEFATERSNEYFLRDLNKNLTRAAADGHTEIEIEEMMKNAPPQHLLLNDGTKEIKFIGDAGSYGWGAGDNNPRGYSPLPPNAVASALMALEQYFYQRLDEGSDIAGEVFTTLSRCRSVGPLGVLANIGKRHMDLFNGPLRALLSAPELYTWEISKAVQGQGHLMIGAFNQGPLFFDLARKFHELAHRKLDLRYIAMERLFKSEEMRTFFARIREWWKRRQALGESLEEMSIQLELALDAANYEVREDPTLGMVIVNVALEKLNSESMREKEEMEFRMLLMSFPIRCRKILEERLLLNEEQLEELWQYWIRIREYSETTSALPEIETQYFAGYFDAIWGGVAVFLFHDEWLDRGFERRHLLENTIQTIIDASRKILEFDSGYVDLTWTWDCFFADALSMLWLRNTEDAHWRRLVAEMVFIGKYNVVRLMFTRCAEHRAVLGEDFLRLRRLAVDWAYMRGRINLLRRWEQLVPEGNEQVRVRLQRDLKLWTEQAIDSFVKGTLEPLHADWNRFSDASRFAELDAYHPRQRDLGGMDFHFLRCSHEWMPLLYEAHSQEERKNIIQFWRVALEMVAERPRADFQRRDHNFPHEDELWVLENAAAIVLHMHPEEKPEHIWRVILDLHGEAHVWSERFLDSLHRHALTAEQPPKTYGPLVRQIVLYAFTEVDQGRRWPWYEEVWDALIGIDWTLGDLWTERHANDVANIWDVISIWMEKVHPDGRRLARFASWLSKPSAKIIRLQTLPWFFEHLCSGEQLPLNKVKVAENDIAKLLFIVWEHEQNILRSKPELFTAFRGLLSWLVKHQNSLGLELHGRIGGRS